MVMFYGRGILRTTHDIYSYLPLAAFSVAVGNFFDMEIETGTCTSFKIF